MNDGERTKRLVLVVGGLAAISAAVAFISPEPDSVFSRLPPDQRAFIAAVRQGRTAYNNRPNDLADDVSRPARARAICSALSSKMEISDWSGRVTKIDRFWGKGVLYVELDYKLTLKTLDIEIGSPLYQQVSAAKQGDMIRFSGSFAGSPQDCVKEWSRTLEGSMLDPEFPFTFTHVGPLR